MEKNVFEQGKQDAHKEEDLIELLKYSKNNL